MRSILPSILGALATLSARASSSQGQVHWAAGAQAAIVEESLLHDEWLAAHPAIPAEQGGIRRGAPSAVTMGYTNFLRATAAGEDYVVGAAAALPCYWLYLEIGYRLLEKTHEEHPYNAWIPCMAAKSSLRMCAAAWRLLRKHLSRLPPVSVLPPRRHI